MTSTTRGVGVLERHPEHSLLEILAGVIAFREFLITLLPVFQNNNFLVIYSVIHYEGFYFSDFLVTEFLKNPGTQSSPN